MPTSSTIAQEAPPVKRARKKRVPVSRYRCVSLPQGTWQATSSRNGAVAYTIDLQTGICTCNGFIIKGNCRHLRTCSRLQDLLTHAGIPVGDIPFSWSRS